jgi:taurine dioxygenase
MEYKHIVVTPLVGGLGAEISGIDLRKSIDATTVTELEQAFYHHALLVLRGQSISIEQQKDLSRIFGDLHIHPMFEAMENHPEVLEFVKNAGDKVNVGGNWHADLTCLAEPPAVGVLRVTETPAVGGDTLFANMYAAYEALSAPMQQFLTGLEAIHTSLKVYGPMGKYAQSKGKTQAPAKTDGAVFNSVHPVVRTHPITGRKSLFVNRANTLAIKGLSSEESATLLEFLFQHAVRGEFTSRLHWQKDTIAIWDNRCTQHYALNDYHGYRRVGLRITVAGDRPV